MQQALNHLSPCERGRREAAGEGYMKTKRFLSWTVPRRFRSTAFP